MRTYDRNLASGALGILPMDAELYLHDFRRGLLALPEAERIDIIDEIRGQFADQAADSPESLRKLMARLGRRTGWPASSR